MVENRGVCPNCNTDNSYSNYLCSYCRHRLPWGDAILQAPQVEDEPSVLLNVFSILIPVIGIAAWLILMNSSPRRSREAGISALAGVMLVPVTYFLLIYFMRP